MDDRHRWVLRCVDLLSRDSTVVTQLDRATGHVLLHVTGSKSVVLPIETAARLRRHLGEAIRSSGSTIPDE